MHTVCSRLRLIIIFTAICFMAAMTPAAQAKDFLIVLDPGHGGRDPGTHGKHSNEKDICLSVSNKVKALLKNHHGLKIDATRTTDTYVTLDARANKGNKSMCDLFVSIHCNSLDKSNPKRTTYSGATVYTMSKDRSTENLAIVKAENSVIELDKLYAPEEQKFDSDELAILSELNQTANIHHSVLAANLLQTQLVKTAGRHDLGTKKAGFLVLRKLTRPSVLIEIDFLCNPTVESFLTSEEGQNKIAKAIANGLIAYKNAQTDEEKTTEPQPESSQPVAQANEPVKTQPAVSQPTEDKESDEYRIQFLTSSKILAAGDNRLKGIYPADYYLEKGIYKYTFGHFASPKDAATELRRIRNIFPDAFVIHFKNGHRIK